MTIAIAVVGLSLDVVINLVVAVAVVVVDDFSFEKTVETDLEGFFGLLRNDLLRLPAAIEVLISLYFMILMTREHFSKGTTF